MSAKGCLNGRINSIIAVAWCFAGGLFIPLAAYAEVGASVHVSQPGFYGRIDIGARPAPPVIYPHPIVIAPAPITVVQQPIYLRVPPGHAKHWHKHCHRYHACGQQAYFVQEAWYNDVYAPGHRYRRQDDHRGRHGHKRARHERGDRDRD